MVRLLSVPLPRETVADQLGPAIEATGISIRAIDLAGQIIVSFAWPDLAPNTVDGTDPWVLWLSPTRRLLVGGAVAPVPPEGVPATDVGDGLAVFELTGPRLAGILQMACPLDPDGADFTPGRCAQTLFAGQRVILYSHRSRDRVRLHIERPLAHYLQDWLRQAAGALR